MCVCGGSYLSAEVQSVYSAAPANWANIFIYIYIYTRVCACVCVCVCVCTLIEKSECFHDFYLFGRGFFPAQVYQFFKHLLKR